MGTAPWAILDFPGPDGQPVRKAYRDPAEIIAARVPAEVRPALDRAEAAARDGMTLVGFVAYDAAPGLEPKFEIRPGYVGPLVWFAAFAGPSAGVPTGPDAQPSAGAAPGESWVPDFEPDRYEAKVADIIEGIGRGDYYQVNLTERFRSDIASPLAVYERLRDAQKARYSAFIDTAEMAVLSVSPELFLHREGPILESRPMKGTSRRGRWSAEDNELAARLANSEKERAENVMIVDLVRNDMGRVAIPGTVHVPTMFAVEKYPTVLQMTSHVKSELQSGVGLTEIFAALFPCGSVTGAPKLAATRSITLLESNPRGVYCGAVGVIRPGGEDFTFNVAIRTATVALPEGRAVYGAGGGITADSDPRHELAELKAKAAVLTSVPMSLDLLETLRLENGHVHRLDAHLGRLESSASYFGFSSIDVLMANVGRSIDVAAASNPTGLWRLRVVARPNGSHEVNVLPHAADTGPRRLRLSRTPVQSGDPRLYHKLADRAAYSARQKEAGNADDAILVNERGELTETTIGNLVLEIGGRRLTPALECGLLPGVFRASLLATGEIEEAVLAPDDLKRATRAWMINSLRGWVDCVVLS